MDHLYNIHYLNYVQLISTLALFLKHGIDEEFLVWPVTLFHDATTL